MAPLPHDCASRLEAGQLDYCCQSKGSGEKSEINSPNGVPPPSVIHDDDIALTERKTSARRLLAMLFLSFLVTFGVATAISPRSWHRQPCPGEIAAPHNVKVEGNWQDHSSFKSMLETASPHSLHELLHKYFPDTFKDGVWESDVSAVEALRRVDEPLAVNIVQLAKRQDNGTTTSTPEPSPTPQPSTTPPPPPPPTTSNPPPATSNPPPPAETMTPTTAAPTTAAPTTAAPTTVAPPATEAPPTTKAPGTTAPTTAAPETTSPPAEITSDGPSQTTSDNDAPPPPTRGTTSPGTSSSPDIVETETSSSSPLVPTAAPLTTSTSRGASQPGSPNTSRPGLSSTSRSPGGTTMITERPTGRPSLTTPAALKPVTSTFTSTRPDGGVVIVTATTYVPAETQETGAATTTRATPSLQNAAAGRQGKHFIGAVAGIVFGVMMLI